MDVRKVIKIGNSEAITIPWKVLRSIGCLVGDHVTITLKKDRIEVKKLKGPKDEIS